MDSSERLELSFYAHPRLTIRASLFSPRGSRVVQSSVQDSNCPPEWVSALQSIAAAVKDASDSETGSGIESPVSSLQRPPWSLTPAARSGRTSIDGRCDRLRCLPASPDRLFSRNAMSDEPVRRDSMLFDLPLPVDFGNTSAVVPPLTSPVDRSREASAAPHSPDAMSRRLQRLNLQLDSIQDDAHPAKDVFNETVRQLHHFSAASPGTMSSVEDFGVVLGRLGDISSAVGIVYSLLSWEIFRCEEDRLVTEEGLTSLAAAKQINHKMAQKSNRRAKAKDWASDGRKAAGMVFVSIAGLTPAVRSFALIVLADNFTRDGLLRIAHFPVLRARFHAFLSDLVQSRSTAWEHLASHGYLIFDDRQFLDVHVRSGGTQARPPTAEQSMSALQTPPSHASIMGPATYGELFGTADGDWLRDVPSSIVAVPTAGLA